MIFQNYSLFCLLCSPFASPFLPTEIGRHFASVITGRHSHLSPVDNLSLSSFPFSLSLFLSLSISPPPPLLATHCSCCLSSAAKPGGTLSTSSPTVSHISLGPATCPSLPFPSLFLSFSFHFHITIATTASDPRLLPPLTGGD